LFDLEKPFQTLLKCVCAFAVLAIAIAKAEKKTGVISGNKAVGGSVQGGKSYIVGEMGREMFTPSSNGTITPNNQLSQPMQIVVNVGGSVVSERNLVEAIRIGLINAQKSGKVLVV